MNTKKLVVLAMLLAVAVIFGYVEAIIPVSIGIPGVKLGLANIVTFVILYVYGAREGMVVGIMRILIVGFMFSNLSMIAYSMSGFIVSYIFMIICKKIKAFSDIGVSVVGGVTHNITQLLVAAVLTGLYTAVVSYIPWLLLSGLVAGAVIGFLGQKCIIVTDKLIKKIN